MSAMDTVSGTCPACGDAFSAETKLGERRGHEISVGHPFAVPNMAVELKTPCECGQYLTAVIKDQRLVELRIGGARLREGLWGETTLASESREHFDRRQVEEFRAKVATSR